VGDTFSLDGIGNLAVLEEFKQRATSLVAIAIKPLEARLLDQVSSLIRDSQEAISAKSKGVQNESLQGDISVENRMSSSSTTAKCGDILLTTPTQELTESGLGGQMDFQLDQSGQLDFDSLFNNWDSSPNVTNQTTIGRPAFEFPLGSNPLCSCMGACTCQMLLDRHSSTPSQTGYSTEALPFNKAADVMNLLQNMSKSIQALEKRLQCNQDL